MRDLSQLHVDLLRQDGDGVTPEARDNHGPEVCDVLALSEGGDATAYSVPGFYYDNLHTERPGYTKNLGF